MTQKAKATTGTAQPTPVNLPNLNRKGIKEAPTWGPIAVPSAPAAATVKQPTMKQAAAQGLLRAPRRRKGRTMQQIVDFHPRTDPETGQFIGYVGFTFRELCPNLHVAAESMRAAIINPGRLTLSSVLALAKLMGEPPINVLMDLIAEVEANPNAEALAARKARTTLTRPQEATPVAAAPKQRKVKAAAKKAAAAAAAPEPTAKASKASKGKDKTKAAAKSKK